jgi:hypothetical protein
VTLPRCPVCETAAHASETSCPNTVRIRCETDECCELVAPAAGVVEAWGRHVEWVAKRWHLPACPKCGQAPSVSLTAPDGAWVAQCACSVVGGEEEWEAREAWIAWVEAEG